jgi:Fe2+ or Zn2+ uptake regulation protein
MDVARDLTDRLAADVGFRVDLEHFAIYGRCQECSNGLGLG